MKEYDFAARVRNIKASRFMYRVDVVARVESEDDIAFWQKAIHHVRPTVKAKFIPAEVSESNERQRGKTLCMKLVDYLDEHLLICVDSDFDKFLHPKLLESNKYVLQTHVYSWENHHCQAENLQRQWRQLDCDSFDFCSFLISFSQALYPALVSLLAAKNNGMKSWRLDDLCREILDVHVNQKLMLKENGKQLLKDITTRIETWMGKQQPLAVECYEKMEKDMSDIGVTENNAYLYMQGHCVYDLVLRIGNFLCNKKYDFMYEVLTPAFSCSGYTEIEKVKADIAKIL